MKDSQKSQADDFRTNIESAIAATVDIAAAQFRLVLIVGFYLCTDLWKISEGSQKHQFNRPIVSLALSSIVFSTISSMTQNHRMTVFEFFETLPQRLSPEKSLYSLIWSDLPLLFAVISLGQIATYPFVGNARKRAKDVFYLVASAQLGSLSILEVVFDAIGAGMHYHPRFASFVYPALPIVSLVIVVWVMAGMSLRSMPLDLSSHPRKRKHLLLPSGFLMLVLIFLPFLADRTCAASYWIAHQPEAPMTQSSAAPATLPSTPNSGPHP